MHTTFVEREIVTAFEIDTSWSFGKPGSIPCLAALMYGVQFGTYYVFLNNS
jgi:hypothetical protein